VNTKILPNYKILSALFQFLPVEEIDYLCADFHVYQESKLAVTHGGKTIMINQYIVGTGGTELDEYPSEIIFSQLKPAILSLKKFEDLFQEENILSLENGVSIHTPKNNFKVDAVHIKSERFYGYAVIRPNEPPRFIKVMKGDDIVKEEKKEKKPKGADPMGAELLEKPGGTKQKRKKRKRTKRK